MQQRNVTLIVETSLGSGREILRGIARYSREHGPWLFHHEWRNTDLHYPPWLDDWSGDGIIARIESRRIRKKLKSFGVPVVDVLGSFPDKSIPVVHVDDRAIGEAAAGHFLDRGYTRFGYCGLKGVDWSDRRGTAFRDAVLAEGGTCSVHAWDAARRDAWSWDREVADMTSWLRSLDTPAGVMLCNDLHSHFILQACRRGGIRIPDDLAMIGVDNDPSVCDLCEPPLSSVVSDDEKVGYEAAGLLDDMMQGRKRTRADSTWIKPRGVRTRQSSDALAVQDTHVAAAVRFIRDHAFDGIGLTDVVQAVPVSRSVLQERFKAALGHTIHDEIMNQRMDHARFLLEQSDRTLADIAEKCGFSQQSYFGYVFRKVFGMTPHTYRSKYRDQGA